MESDKQSTPEEARLFFAKLEDAVRGVLTTFGLKPEFEFRVLDGTRISEKGKLFFVRCKTKIYVAEDLTNVLSFWVREKPLHLDYESSVVREILCFDLAKQECTRI